MTDGTYREGASATMPVIVTTGNDIAGYQIVDYLGIVRGIIVRSTGFTKSIVGGLRSLAAGNIPEFVQVCEQARQDAYLSMMEHAQKLGANAVIGMRYDATEFMGGTTEVLAYGTAVRLRR